MPEVTLTSELSPLSDTDVLVDDNRKTMIKVDHVTMEFNMASEQLNSLKEYVIAIAKRRLYFEKFTALDDISFEVKKGDVFGILGTNGSGKSTLLKIIAGVLEPTKGSCEINGNIAPLIELGAGFDMELSARENIYLNGSLLGYSKTFIEEHFNDIVEFAEIEKFLDMPMKNYSSGMIARIAFAIATVIIPEILIVDEVLSVGDFMFQQKCENRINDLIENHGVTVLIVSHNNDQIERLCNKAIWIEKGHTRIEGNAKEVTTLYKNLGGRTGDKKAESSIIATLEEYPEIQNPSDSKLQEITGKDSDAVNMNLLSMVEPEDLTSNTVILASTFTHTNAVMANGIAGALKAPIIPFDPNELNPTIDEWLNTHKPNHIIIVDRGNFIDTAIIKCINEYNWNPQLTIFNEPREMLNFSCKLFKMGMNENWWKDTVALINFDRNQLSMAAGPLLFNRQIPVFFILHSDEPIDEMLSALKDASTIKNIIIFGSDIPKEVDHQFRENGFNINRVGESKNDVIACLEVTDLVTDSLQDTHLVQIGSYMLAAWTDLLSTGCFGGATNTPLLLCDSTNLDSIEGCIDYLERNNVISGFNIHGDVCIFDSEITLFDRIITKQNKAMNRL